MQSEIEQVKSEEENNQLNLQEDLKTEVDLATKPVRNLIDIVNPGEKRLSGRLLSLIGLTDEQIDRYQTLGDESFCLAFVMSVHFLLFFKILALLWSCVLN
jgi:hypothetical protein